MDGPGDGTRGWQAGLPPDVTALLDRLAALLTDALGPALVGLYLHGSLVAGDFAPARSDVDLLAVLAAEPDEALLGRLGQVHDELDRAFPAWRGRVEVEYVGAGTVAAHAGGSPGPATLARVSPGEALHLLPATSHRVLTWSSVRALGVALVGPPATQVLPWSSEEASTAALLDHVRDWPAWVVPMTAAGGQAYAVLTLCRAAARLRTGRHLSKKAAADVVAGDLTATDPGAADLVRWARDWWYAGGEDDAPPRTAEVRRFVEDTCARLLAEGPDRGQRTASR